MLSLTELLEHWWRDTPQAILPGRRIGSLADGFEASLLVLEADPTRALQALKKIRLRLKQGALLT